MWKWTDLLAFAREWMHNGFVRLECIIMVVLARKAMRAVFAIRDRGFESVLLLGAFMPLAVVLRVCDHA